MNDPKDLKWVKDFLDAGNYISQCPRCRGILGKNVLITKGFCAYCGYNLENGDDDDDE